MGTDISSTANTPTLHHQNPESVADAPSTTSQSAGRGVQSSPVKCHLARAFGYAAGTYMVCQNFFQLADATSISNTTNYMSGNTTETDSSMTELTKDTIKAGVGALTVLGVGLTIFCYDVVLGKRTYNDPYAEYNKEPDIELSQKNNEESNSDLATTSAAENIKESTL